MKGVAAFRAVLATPAGIFASTVLAGVLLAVVIAPFLYPDDPFDLVAVPFLWPWEQAEYPLGTDLIGRDITAGLLHGASVSLTVGAVAAVISLIIGVSLGAVAGYFGGWVDDIIMRVTELFQTIRRSCSRSCSSPF